MSEIKQRINAIYAQLKLKNPSIEIRDQQVNLSEDTANALLQADSPLIGEAPTGTGKTIGYLIGALAVQEKAQIPIVIATATVNLQDQIVENDIPKLIEIGLLKAHEVMRAKGRGRYYCALSGEKYIEKLENFAEQGDMFNSTQEKKPLRKIDLKEVIKIHADYQNKQWDGEVDNLNKKPYFWDRVQATADTCLGKGCKFFNECEFFKKRKALGFAKVIVANQDLVLADLMLAEEDKEPIFGMKNYLLIVDECHHFPKKALSTSTKKVNLTEAITLLKQIPLLTKKLFMKPELVQYMHSKNVDSDYILYQSLLEDATVFDHWIKDTFSVDEKMTDDFCIKTLLAKEYFRPKNYDYIKQQTKKIADSALIASNRLQQVIDILKGWKKLSDIKDGVSLLYESILISSAVKQMSELFTNFNREDINYARWIEKKTHTNKETQEKTIDYLIHLAPIEAREFFRRVLWNTTRVKLAMVSATVATGKRFKDKSLITSKMLIKTTLTNSKHHNHSIEPTYVVRDFTPFVNKINAPDSAKVAVYPSVFPYHKSILEVPQMQFIPKDSEYTSEVIQKIKDSLAKHKKIGNLILFTSKVMMRKVYDALHKEYNILSQELESDLELIRKHKESVDKGKQSILLGMQKFSEGLDLPGAYCEHLMIARLPFAVPTDPIEEEIKYLDEKGYFNNHVLPETAIKFIQMCGRLIRRTEDIGVITIFDTRLTTTNWGLLLLDSIPDYTQDVQHQI